MFRHFLVTRFNLRVDSWDQTKNGEKVLTEDWLEKRFYLFENFCLPSVKNQHNQQFTWCIYFDENTPVPYRKRISVIAEAYSNIKVFYINGADSLKSSLATFIKSHVNSEDQYIITTRLDNDDMIHQEFIAVIQSLFVPAEKTVIDLQNGYQLCIENDHAEVRNYTNLFNPFISLVEEISFIKTVFSLKHKDWVKIEDKIEYKGNKLWCEVVHRSNMLNSVNRGGKKLFGFNFSLFGLDGKKYTLEPASKIFFFNLGLYKEYFLKNISAKIKLLKN